jgi:indole-3-glycerol phosphate synthase
MSDVLQRIVEYKQREVAEAQARLPEADLAARCRALPPVRPFRDALLRRPGMAVIAEVKRASPSAGVIKEDFDPVTIARAYADAGAACISVLTDTPSFHGKLEYLSLVRAKVDVPLLRKDFLLGRYQLLEARLAGADCVLLIAEILPGDELAAMLRQAEELGLEALVELYDPENLPRVLATGARLVGVNNRDLRTFHVSLDQTLKLAPHVPADVCLVSESGIKSGDDVRRLRAAGVRAVLVGETLMRSGDIAATMRELSG